MIRVKLFPWWTSVQGFTEKFKRQFIGSYYNHPDVVITTDDDYDYAIVFGYTKEPLKTDKEHTIYFFMEPSWSCNWDREAYKKSSRVFCTTKKLFGNYDEFIEHKAYTMYGGHDDKFFDLDYILDYKKTNKEKNLSCVVTNRTTSPVTGDHHGNIYRERVLLAESLIKNSIDVDIFGFLWEYSDFKVHKAIKGTCFTKFQALDDYMFSIGIENSAEPNYITEKFYDILFFNTVPVYFGAPNIKAYPELSEAAIILDNIDINNTEKNIEIIRNLTPELYFSKMQNIMSLKKSLYDSLDFNIWKRIIFEVTK
jgi:hypothetical protein